MLAKYKTVGTLIEIEDSLYIVTPEGETVPGRLIFEEYDSKTGSGENSRFYEVKTIEVASSKEKDGAEVIGHLKLNLSDSDSAEELTEET